MHQTGMEAMRLVVHGAAGRMGRRIVACAVADPRWRVVHALEHRGSPHLGADAGTLAGVSPLGVHVCDHWEAPDHRDSKGGTADSKGGFADAGADCIIDFSLPGAVGPMAKLAAERGVPLVVATTGLEAADQEAVRIASAKVAVLQSPSMSLAVNVAMDLVERAGRLLSAVGGRTDVEIVECHHRHKEDAPSGTALKFGAIVADAMRHAHPAGTTREAHGRHGRVGARPAGEIGYHAIRAGDNPGEHTILFGLEGESLSVNVRATSRDCYATGALAAAAFLVGKPAGLYSMRDVLGL